MKLDPVPPSKITGGNRLCFINARIPTDVHKLFNQLKIANGRWYVHFLTKDKLMKLTPIEQERNPDRLFRNKYIFETHKMAELYLDAFHRTNPHGIVEDSVFKPFNFKLYVSHDQP